MFLRSLAWLGDWSLAVISRSPGVYSLGGELYRDTPLRES